MLCAKNQLLFLDYIVRHTVDLMIKVILLYEWRSDLQLNLSVGNFLNEIKSCQGNIYLD